MSIIKFYDYNIRSGLRNRKALKAFLDNLFRKEKKIVSSVDIIFCNDQYLRTLNHKFLNHNYNTDTVTFNLSVEGEALIAEAYLSIDTIKQNALRFQEPYQTELVRVILHSCLHMAGFSDKLKLNKEEMISKQEFYLREWLRFT